MTDELCLQSDPVKELEKRVDIIVDKLERGTPHLEEYMEQTQKRIKQLEEDVAQLQRLVIPYKYNGGYG